MCDVVVGCCSCSHFHDGLNFITFTDLALNDSFLLDGTTKVASLAIATLTWFIRPVYAKGGYLLEVNPLNVACHVLFPQGQCPRTRITTTTTTIQEPWNHWPRPSNFKNHLVMSLKRTSLSDPTIHPPCSLFPTILDGMLSRLVSVWLGTVLWFACQTCWRIRHSDGQDYFRIS